MSDSPMVLALDIATVTGAAYGRAGGTPYFETWDFSKHNDLAGRTYRMMCETHAIIEKLRPSLVVIERPLPPAVLYEIGATEKVFMTLVGLAAVALAVCGAHKVPCQFIDRQKVLLHFVGRSSFPRRSGGRSSGEAKRACVARCRQLGWKINSEDEADAAALWDFSCSQLRADIAIKQGLSRPVKASGRRKSEQEGFL